MERRKCTPAQALAAIPVWVLLAVLALVVIVPISWILLGTFKPEKEIISYPPTFWPETFTLENFLIVGKRIKIWRYMLNSFIYAFGTTAFAAFVNSLAGYVYARYEFRGKNVCFLLTLATMMIPFQVIMVPLFLIVHKMGMYNTYWGLIVPRIAVAVSIFMMRGLHWPAQGAGGCRPHRWRIGVRHLRTHHAATGQAGGDLPDHPQL